MVRSVSYHGPGLRAPVLVGAIIALTIAACAGVDGAGEPIARDSAGVRIVETTPNEWPPAEFWRIAESPDIDIGVRTGDADYELYDIKGVVSSSNGGVAVAESGARVRFYDSAGTHVRTLDLQGEGPGEFSEIDGIFTYRSDSLMLTSTDDSRTRFLVLTGDGDHGRELEASYPELREPDESSFWFYMTNAGVHAVLGGGSIIVVGATHVVFGGTGGDALPGTVSLIRLDPEGVLVDTVATVQSTSFEYRPELPPRMELMIDVDAPPARAHGTHVYHTSGQSFAVDIFDTAPLTEPGTSATAGPARSYRLEVARSPYTDAIRQDHIAPLIEIYRRASQGRGMAEFQERMASIASPDSVPAIQDLRVDALGNIWLETYQAPGAAARSSLRSQGASLETGASTWVVLDPDGRLLGSVLMPMRFDVTEIGADHVAGIWYDELGVQHARRYAIIKR